MLKVPFFILTRVYYFVFAEILSCFFMMFSGGEKLKWNGTKTTYWRRTTLQTKTTATWKSPTHQRPFIMVKKRKWTPKPSPTSKERPTSILVHFSKSDLENLKIPDDMASCSKIYFFNNAMYISMQILVTYVLRCLISWQLLLLHQIYAVYLLFSQSLVFCTTVIFRHLWNFIEAFWTLLIYSLHQCFRIVSKAKKLLPVSKYKIFGNLKKNR